ncbi:hypothetical protein GCM10028805_17070 [Spirosoma harenae]
MTSLFRPAIAQNWNQIIAAAASDAAVGDNLGVSVSISGDYAIVGAPTKNFIRGAAYVFIRSGNTWIQQAALTASDAALGDNFGISVSLSGDYAIVGAHTKSTNRGAAYVFVRSGTSWSQQAKLTPSDAALGDQFGVSVSMSGDYAIVGANTKGFIKGAAYVFVRSGTSWSQQAKLSASDGIAGDNFGVSVSMSGDYAIVGANAKNFLRGAAYVFVRSGTSWSQQAKLTPSDPVAGDNFGFSVSISGDYAIVGAHLKKIDTNELQGAAYVFARSGTSWDQQAKLSASDGIIADNFGISVCLSGDYAIIGTPTKSFLKGAAYVFARSGTNWGQQAKLTASDRVIGDNFGVSVAVSGHYAIVGTPTKNLLTGVAYIYERCDIGITTQPDAGSTVCVGSAVTASVSTTGTVSSYQWYKGTTPLEDQTTATLSIPSASLEDADVYSVVVTGATCSLTSTAFNLTVNNLPTVSITADPSLTITQGSSTLLTASGADAYSWSTEENTAQITVDESRTYSVTGTTEGCSSETSVDVIVTTPAPTISELSANPDPVCTGSQVTFTASLGNVSENYSYTLTNGTSTVTGNGFRQSFSQTITASESGFQTYTLIVSNGEQIASETYELTVNELPMASLSASNEGYLTCGTTSVTLTAGGGDDYQFNGPGLLSQDVENGIAVVNISGLYSVTVTNTETGCFNTESVNIYQSTNTPEASLSAPSTTLTCEQSTLTLTAQGGYDLTFDGPGIINQGENSIEVNVAGVYSVTVTDAESGCFSVASLTITQDATPPVVSITANPSLTITEGSSTVLTASGANSYKWSTSETTDQITVSESQTYSVTGSIGSCSSETSVVVIVIANTPTITGFKAIPNPVCVGSPVTFTASLGNLGEVYNYTLTNGSSTMTGGDINSSFSQTITPSQASSQSFTLIISTNNQVVWSSDEVVVRDLPIPTLTASNEGLLTCQQTSLTLTAGGGETYLFSPNVVSQSGSKAVVNASGTYSVTVTTSGCSSVTSIDVNQQPDQTIAFTQQPASSSSVTVGTNVATSVGVSGEPMGFQWYKDNLGNPLGGQTSATLALNAVQLSDAGNYFVIVTSACNSLTSNAFELTVNPVQTFPFAITAVTTVACTPITPAKFSLSFSPRYSGLTGQPISFSVVNELLPTNEAGPYTIQIYTDNPVIILKATQTGSPNEASFTYNWSEACQTSENPNTVPRVVTPLTAQTATVGSFFSYVIPPGTFTDSETPLSLQLSAQGVPNGLMLTGATLSGIPSTTVGSPFTLSIIATDPKGLSVSTPLTLVVLPATEPVNPTAPFAITGVTTISCTPVASKLSLTFAPQYSGRNGQPIAFEVINEMVPTTDPAPYSLTMYRDNPVIVLKASQGGSEGPVTFTYHWLDACMNLGQDNTPPRVNSPVGNQTAVVGQAFNLNLVNTFADQETPDGITLSTTGLPAGLSLVGTSITGTPSVSGVSNVTIKATDPGNLTVSTSFMLTVNPAGSEFGISGVQTINCETINPGLRRVTFTPQYTGVSGEPISFSVINEMLPTMASGPYQLNLYIDNPVITLVAYQGSSKASYVYSWLAVCSSGARQSAAESGLQVRVLGNPVTGSSAEVEIQGVLGQRVELELVNQQGYRLHQQSIDQADLVNRLQVPVGSAVGTLLLQVRSGSQAQTLKVIKNE